MGRYFLAIPLAEAIQDDLLAVQPPHAPGIRLIPKEELHLTLHFLGAVSPSKLDVAVAALKAVEIKIFTMTVQGVGTFPPKGPPTVLWAGVVNCAPLMELHREVGNALSMAIAFQPESRPYSPHITLARLKPSVSPGLVDRFLQANLDLQIPAVRLTKLILFSSVLKENAAHYERVQVFPFL